MPDVCSASTSPWNCGHRLLVVSGRTLIIHESEIGPLSDEERDQLFTLAIRHKGVALASLLNRVVYGDEATNVKLYTFLGPGAAITKTNIGTAYVNICPGLNGERIVADFTGCTEFRFMLNANLVGTGEWGARCVRDTDSAVLIEQANLGVAGERELDSDWQVIPAAFLGTGLTFLRIQGKSQTASDDPSFRRIQLGLR